MSSLTSDLTMFSTIERNLNSVVMAPRSTRDELLQHVYRPTFKRVFYPPLDFSASSPNIDALARVMRTLDINDDPFVISLRKKLQRLPEESEEWRRADQKLSQIVDKKDSFIHKGLRDFRRTASEICADVGPWGSDWFVQSVVDRALKSTDPKHLFYIDRNVRERDYLIDVLERVNAQLQRVSYHPGAIVSGSGGKFAKLIDALLEEKKHRESLDECYSGIVFVTRRDTVLTLTEMISHHPLTRNEFTVGSLLGGAEGTKKTAFLDITRTLLKQSQSEALSDFRTNAKSLLVSTAVAEEGIDIQACGSVIRWDIPPNMVSWTQSRGRARKKESTFILMFEEGGIHAQSVGKWEALEREMVKQYNDEQRLIAAALDVQRTDEDGDEEESLEYRIPATG